MKTKNVLLLTATITPKSGVPNLKRTDPALRLKDYEQAFKFYLSKLNQCCDAIVFAENSNSEISSLEKLVKERNLSDQVEFIVFNGLDYPPHYDRAYGEFKLIDYAMENSAIIARQPENTIVWKITGRYIVENIDKLINRQPNNFGIYCNFRNFPKHWVDTFLIAWTPKAYQTCLQNIYQKLRLNEPDVPTNSGAEELLRKWFDQQSNIKFVRRFKVTPLIEGFRGADNRGYTTNDLWKFRVRSSINTLFPWLWI
ncbi:MAG: hypothetical protein DCF22_01810 [Leptolyngbya sp.]|nr:MAG: hypothetical protein DCF22_01810 [Leptolyngbya sp.]